jgi:hypothetical protein
MPEYKSAKLIVSNKGGECALCDEQFEPGVPIWYHNYRAYCANHTEAEIMAESETRVPSPSKSAPISDSVTSQFWTFQIEGLMYKMQLICDAIKENTAIQERIWNERRP